MLSPTKPNGGQATTRRSKGTPCLGVKTNRLPNKLRTTNFCSARARSISCALETQISHLITRIVPYDEDIAGVFVFADAAHLEN